MKRKLDEAAWVQLATMAELGVLTASLMHELRQPLFAIKATAQLAVADGADPWAARVLAQVEHMEELVEYYGSFGRENEPEALFDLNDPVRTAVEMLSHRSRRLQAEISVELDPEALLVRGRPAAARQVTVNLLQNAYDALEDVTPRRLLVRTLGLTDRVRLEVSDSGPGVPPALRETVFEPFVTTKPPGRGTGLGLFITRQLVQAAHGELRVSWPDQGGTRIEVELPRAA